MKTTTKHDLLRLSKELIEKLHARKKEPTLQYDLLKQTFFEHRKPQQRFKQLEEKVLGARKDMTVHQAG